MTVTTYPGCTPCCPSGGILCAGQIDYIPTTLSASFTGCTGASGPYALIYNSGSAVWAYGPDGSGLYVFVSCVPGDPSQLEISTSLASASFDVYEQGTAGATADRYWVGSPFFLTSSDFQAGGTYAACTINITV